MHGFRFCFTPLTGVLFYYSLSVAELYLAFEDGPSEFTPGSTGLALLGISARRAAVFAYRTFTFCGGPFTCPSTNGCLGNSVSGRQTAPADPTTPATQRLSPYMLLVWAASHFARRYYGNRFFFLFLRVLRCFNSPRSPTTTMHSPWYTGGTPRWVSPFGHLRIKACLRLPEAYRSYATSFIATRHQGIRHAPFSA